MSEYITSKLINLSVTARTCNMAAKQASACGDQLRVNVNRVDVERLLYSINSKCTQEEWEAYIGRINRSMYK